MYRVTETREQRVVNRKSIEQARLIAYDAMYRMMEAQAKLDTVLAWKHFKTIHNWTGKHTILRAGSEAVTLETV